jgi:predicted AlkP superfamily phosphohydrolase/phosphomutase
MKYRSRYALPLVAASLGACGAPEPGPSERVFLIGIDGATWSMIDPLLAQGKLPNLGALIAEGSRTDLESMIPTKSPALWTTLVTGKEFAKHGIDDFTMVTREDGTENERVMHMTSNLRKTKALWNILGEEASGSAFIGWWVSWPAEKVNGVIVSSHVPLEQTGGKGAPTKGTLVEGVAGMTWPPELFDELVPLVRSAESVTYEEARRFMEIEPDELDRDIVEGFRWAFAADETYRAVTKYVLAREPELDLYGIYFNGIDVVGHRYWKYLEPAAYPPFPRQEIPRFDQVIRRYYEYTDELIGEVLSARRPGDTILLVSDHGFHARGHKDGPAGVLVAAGTNVAKGAPFPSPPPRLVDVTPTILALLGLPGAKDMDGRVLDELFTEAWRKGRPNDEIDTYDTDDWREQSPLASDVDEELMRRLKTLGYLE